MTFACNVFSKVRSESMPVLRSDRGILLRTRNPRIVLGARTLLVAPAPTTRSKQEVGVLIAAKSPFRQVWLWI